MSDIWSKFSAETKTFFEPLQREVAALRAALRAELEAAKLARDSLSAGLSATLARVAELEAERDRYHRDYDTILERWKGEQALRLAAEAEVDRLDNIILAANKERVRTPPSEQPDLSSKTGDSDAN